MSYCTDCGNRLDDNAAFCTNCGAKVNKIVPKPTVNTTQAFIAARQQAEQQVTVKKKGKKKLFPIILAWVMVIVLIITAFFKPGFLRKKHTPGDDINPQTITGTENTAGGDEGDSSETDPYYDLRIVDSDYEIIIDDYELVPVAEETIGEGNNMIFGEGVSLAVEPELLEEDHTAYISRTQGTVNCDFAGVNVPLTIVDCKIDGITSDSMIYINIPLKLEENEIPGAGYIDEEGTMHPIPHHYDRETGILTIYTTHLSRYCGFPVNNERMSNAMLSYVFADDCVGDEDADINLMLEFMEASRLAEGDLSMAMEIANGLSNGGFVAGNLVSAAGLLDGMVSTTADGAGDFIFTKGTIGTVGEIMNTNWGKAGTLMPGERKYGAALKASSINDKFASKYPSSFLEKAGKTLNRLNMGVSVIKLGNTIANKGWMSGEAAGAATKTAIDTALALLGESAQLGSYGLNVYLIGVSLLEYALDTFYSEAIEGREQVYITAYQRYYQNKGTDGGYRSAAAWIRIFNDILDNGGGQKEMEAEIDRYVNEFWEKADQMGPEYLDSILTEDDRSAWGAEAQGGLSDALRKKISDSYKATLNETMPNILRVLSLQRKTALLEKYQQEYDNFIMQMNQTVTLRICTEYTGMDFSQYKGCIVRFKDIDGKVDDPLKWQTTLNSEGSGAIRFTFLGHLMANAGTTVEIVRAEDGFEEYIDTLDFVFKTDNTGKYPKLYAVLMLHEESEEPLEPQDVYTEPEDYPYEPEGKGTSDESGIPTHFVYYSDSVNREEFGSAEVLKPLADSFKGSSLDISDGTFTIRGNDTGYHMGKEEMERIMAASGDVDGTLISFGEDWNVSNVELKGTLENILTGEYGYSAGIYIDYFHADCNGYMSMSSSDEYGRDSIETEYSGELNKYESPSTWSKASYLALEEIDGSTCYVMHIRLSIAPAYTEKTHQVHTDNYGDTSTYDDTDEAYGEYRIELVFVGM